MNKWKEEKGITVIAILLIIIAILGIIMAVKLIQPKENINDNNELKSYNELVSEQKRKEQKEKREQWEKEYKVMKTTSKTANVITSIISLGISIALGIGTAKLYEKLHLSKAIVTFTWMYPIIAVISEFLPGILESIIMFIAGIIGVISLGNYFKALGMSFAWAILPFVSLICIAFGITSMIMSNISILALLGLAGIIAFIIAYIISNIKLAKVFERGIGFTVGLVLLPFIFQPILGYQKEN